VYGKIQCIVNKIENKIIKYRRDFHRYPEIGWTEFRTASLIARRLKELGYDIKIGKEVISEIDRMGVPSNNILEKNYERALQQGADIGFISKLKGGFTGVVGILDNGEGPTVAVRFDIDALQIVESKSEEHFPFKEGFYSVNEGAMHACGHDGHIAIGLGVAETLMKIKNNIKGKIKLIFQPAEEGVKGAKAMCKSGILDDVDYLIGGHIGIKALASGLLICGVGGFLATSKFDAFFTGVSAHAGAAPEMGSNVMLSAATAILNLNSIPRNSSGSTRINVGKLICGTARNIIPSTAHMLIETRGETSELNQYMMDYAERILENSAAMHGTKLDINFMGESVSCESDGIMIQKVKEAANNISEYNSIEDEKMNFGASEDFSYMMEEVQVHGGKAVYVLFGSDLKSSHHNSEFDFNEKDLKNAVKLFSMLVYDILK
jgi:aminobenzoyl-glutamate utilization protein A